MFDRIRDLARRPVRELPAGVVLAVCALVLVASAVLIAKTSNDPPSQVAQDGGDPSPAENGEVTLYDEPDDGEPSYEVTNPPAVGHDPDQAPSEQPNEFGRDYPPLESSDAALIRKCARGFLRGYLPYSYGRGDVADISDATRELLAELEHNQPHPPADVAKRRPRVVLVHLADGGLTDPAVVVAVIDDGISRYTLRLRMLRTGFEAWSATDVGEA